MKYAGDTVSLPSVFKALSDPVRRDILLLLKQRRKMSAGEIVAEFELSNATISYHLSCCFMKKAVTISGILPAGFYPAFRIKEIIITSYFTKSRQNSSVFVVSSSESPSPPSGKPCRSFAGRSRCCLYSFCCG